VIDQIFREECARVLAHLTGFLGDVDAAEEATQDAFATAAARWPRDGVPSNPRAWLITTARNHALGMAKVEVSNEELRTVRDAMRELNRLVDQLDRGESEKFVLTKNGQMRAVVVSVERFAALRSATTPIQPDIAAQA
jgi:predicted RNA polymerase sigma factor